MRVLTVDTNSIGSRAFYTSDMSFFSMVGTAINEYNPDYTIFTFDAKNTWRKIMYPGYKAKRIKTEQDVITKALRVQYLRNLWVALHQAGYVCLHVDGYEADDLIASVTAQYPAEHIVMTGDKDLLQLCDNHKVLLVRGNYSNRALCGYAECVAITGYAPDQQALYKALVGEQGDNIPGTPKIGRKGAADLLPSTFGALRDEPRVRANLGAFELSYTLACLSYDVPLTFTWQDGDIGVAERKYLAIRNNH